MENISMHLGDFHPLQIILHGLFAKLLVPIQKYDLSETLLQTSIVCGMKSLGPNHVQIAQLHMDFAQLYLKKSQRELCLQHLEEAYNVYENYFDHRPGATGTELMADIAMQRACFYEE